jgi:hypothetical protein
MFSSSCTAVLDFLVLNGQDHSVSKPVSQRLITEQLRSNISRFAPEPQFNFNANSSYRNEAFNLLNPSG